MELTLSSIKYKLLKIPAIPAKELLNNGLNDSLEKLRCYIQVKVDGQWLPLSDEQVIVDNVSSWEDLTELELACYEYNYNFLSSWKTARIPPGMKSKFKAVEALHVDPVVTALVSNDLATYAELKTYYSLEEAFKLLDILTAKKINEYLATEDSKK